MKQFSLDCVHQVDGFRLPNASDHHAGVSGMSDSSIATTHAISTNLIELNDSGILCIDCDEVFVWTVGEQKFFLDKNLQNPPKRCKDCKKAKNQRLEAIERAKISGIRQPVEVKAKCARCLTMTTVPFYPSQGRPVYCRACFNEGNPLTNGAGNSI